MHSARRNAFTLVELLVVIGIIGVLVAILLPALSSARRQANQAKCAAALRDLGNCLTMYATENRGFYPPVMLLGARVPGQSYSLNDELYPTVSSTGETVPAYWFHFIQKYITKNKIGSDTSDLAVINDVKTRSILWGCPEWEGVRTNTAGGFNRVMTGYGMNIWPTFSTTHPALTAQYPENNNALYQPKSAERNLILNYGLPSQTGTFHKATTYGKNGAERALLMDAKSWAAESGRMPPANAANPPPHQFGLSYVNYTQTNGPFTMADWYRHGKLPKVIPGQPPTTPHTAIQQGGTVRYNVLYCDGHVAPASDKASSWKVLRMRFPE